MTQIIRSIATSINGLAGTHFCAPRRRARVPLRLVLIDRKNQVPVPRTATFEGYTSDISATGLAILLPMARFSEQLLNQSHRTLRIVMELATGAIEAEATVVRYELVQPNDGLMGLGCLLGAQILNMRDCDRERFIEHLRSIN
jgi:PilZ domain-containing protein